MQNENFRLHDRLTPKSCLQILCKLCRNACPGRLLKAKIQKVEQMFLEKRSTCDPFFKRIPLTKKINFSAYLYIYLSLVPTPKLFCILNLFLYLVE